MTAAGHLLFFRPYPSAAVAFQRKGFGIHHFAGKRIGVVVIAVACAFQPGNDGLSIIDEK
jgi:hypothetical protein